MAGKFKTTGFARFFFFLLIAAPIIYSGAAIFKGENPLDAAKRDLGISTSTKSSTSTSIDQNSDNLKSKMYDLKEEVQDLNSEIRNLKKDLAACQSARGN